MIDTKIDEIQGIECILKSTEKKGRNAWKCVIKKENFKDENIVLDDISNISFTDMEWDLLSHSIGVYKNSEHLTSEELRDEFGDAELSNEFLINNYNKEDYLSCEIVPNHILSDNGIELYCTMKKRREKGMPLNTENIDINLLGVYYKKPETELDRFMKQGGVIEFKDKEDID